MSMIQFPVGRLPLACLAGSILLAAPTTAQSGSLVAGAFLGQVRAVGDVDDDGCGDYMLSSAQGWEVRSGATGLPFPHLARSAGGCTGCFYLGLFGDLDVDGHDDLLFTDGNGLIEFASGADGTVLLQYSLPGASPIPLAVDHDGDGHDDVMIAQPVATSGSAGVTTYFVFSGRTGAQIASYPMPYSATNSGHVRWCGDVDGDGHVDLLRTTTSYANPYSVVLLGPQFNTGPATYSGTAVLPAGDTNADGRDELLVGTDLVDVVTGSVVWAMFPWFPMEQWFSADVDGDGAVDALVETQLQGGQVYSGRTHAPWPGVLPSAAFGLGDLDGDGRDDIRVGTTLYELQGAPPASFVRDRGAAGTTSASSRPRIRHRRRPRLGDSLLVDLVGAGGPRLAFLALGGGIDADLAPYGAPGNRAYVDPLAAPALFTDATGHARFTLTVPLAPILVGATLSLQWAVVDPAANAFGIATSNALDCVVGH